MVNHTIDELKEMHWKTLAGLVEQAGGEWTNREDAIALLSGGETGESDAETIDDDAAEAVVEAAPEEPAPEAEAVETVTVEEVPNDGIPVFNPDAPYGVICGISNAAYYQNGHHFAGNKRYLRPDEL